MTWRELSNFLHLQRLAIVPRAICDFTRDGEKAVDTFKRVELATRASLDEAVREFAKTKIWPVLTDQQIAVLYFRLNSGVDLTLALSTNAAGLFSASENRDSEMIEWALNETWEYPGLPRAVRSFSERRPVVGNDPMRN